jgi:CrcB protein
MILLAVAVGGGLGAMLRYVLAGMIQHPNVQFPVGIMVVNITGGLAMGLIIELSALKIQMSPEMRAFLTTGILGGYTTFSTFSLDSVLLIERGEYGGAALYIVGSAVLSILAVFAGMWAVRAL